MQTTYVARSRYLLAIHCTAHVFNTVAKRSYDLYKSVRTGKELTDREKALVDSAKDVLDTAQHIANNIRGFRKVGIAENWNFFTLSLVGHRGAGL